MIPDCEQIVGVLTGWLKTRLDSTATAWVQDRLAVIRTNDTKGFYLAFGLAPRKVGKSDLALTSSELSNAEGARPGWDPRGWSIDQAVRSLFVVSLPERQPMPFVSTLDQLFSAGEVGELVALYQALPLLPFPESHILRAAEGVRSNIKAVFCAVAHRNPFATEQFSEDQWNQMILKCQFIGVSLALVVGLDQRSNARLTSMVIDYIYERRAAKRPVAPEIWRCVGRHADERALADLKLLLATGSTVERQAAALALHDCTRPEARSILSTSPELARQVADGQITWATIDSAHQN